MRHSEYCREWAVEPDAFNRAQTVRKTQITIVRYVGNCTIAKCASEMHIYTANVEHTRAARCSRLIEPGNSPRFEELTDDFITIRRCLVFQKLINIHCQQKRSRVVHNRAFHRYIFCKKWSTECTSEYRCACGCRRKIWHRCVDSDIARGTDLSVSRNDARRHLRRWSRQRRRSALRSWRRRTADI